MFLKCENLQRTGSYKIRGAYNRLSQLTEEEKACGVVAASAGNHAQGVAFAARELGIKATIFMPVGVALPKLQATRDYGADVILRGHTVAEPLLAAAAYAAETGAILIPPFDHPDVVAGQGTLGPGNPRPGPRPRHRHRADRRRRAHLRRRQRAQAARGAGRAPASG